MSEGSCRFPKSTGKTRDPLRDLRAAKSIMQHSCDMGKRDLQAERVTVFVFCRVDCAVELMCEMLIAAGQAFLTVVCYTTARILVPLLSLGHLRVQSPLESHPGDFWWERPFRRLPTGHIGVQSHVATLIGLLLWGALAVVVALLQGI
jgi:hypothetical protein